MTLLDHYLAAVRMYLPRGPDKADILAELRGHLETKLEERQAELGRELAETEEQAVLGQFGEPYVVAARYGRSGRGFAFGPLLLISPATFPVYVGVLLFALAVNVVVASFEILLTGAPFLTLVRRLLVTMLVLFLVFTPVYAALDFFLVRSGKRQRGAPESWLFWTPQLKYVPRWYSAWGLAVMGTVALAWGLWWSVWPEVPALLLGPAAEPLALAPAWQRFQLFLLGLLALGVAQRAFSLVRPEFTSSVWALRLVINVLCVAVLYPMLDSAPLVVAPDASAVSAETVEIARRIDGATRGFMRGFGIYWLLNSAWYALVCALHIGDRAQRRRRRVSAEPPVSAEQE